MDVVFRVGHGAGEAALEHFAQVVGGQEGGVGEAAVAGAFVDEVVGVVAEDAF